MNENLRQVLLMGGFVVSWFVLNKWVLPRFGVST